MMRITIEQRLDSSNIVGMKGVISRIHKDKDSLSTGRTKDCQLNRDCKELNRQNLNRNKKMPVAGSTKI